MAPGLEAPGPALRDGRRQRQPELSDGRVRRVGFPEREFRELFGVGGVGGGEFCGELCAVADADRGEGCRVDDAVFCGEV